MYDDDTFTPHMKTETIIYDKEGKELKRCEGKSTPSPKEYADQLPVTFCVVETTTRIISKGRVEK